MPRRYGVIWRHTHHLLLQNSGARPLKDPCPGTGKVSYPDVIPKITDPGPRVRCPVCNRVLTLLADRNPWHLSEFHHYEIPPHYPRTHRAKGPRRKVERRRRGG